MSNAKSTLDLAMDVIAIGHAAIDLLLDIQAGPVCDTRDRDWTIQDGRDIRDAVNGFFVAHADVAKKIQQCLDERRKADVEEFESLQARIAAIEDKLDDMDTTPEQYRNDPGYRGV